MKLSFFRRFIAAAAVAAGTLASAPALAGPFSNLFVFGDSLSDTGNLNLASGGLYPNLADGPYFGGRYSNGPLWVETLAAELGLPAGAVPYLLGGNNFAYAGARTGVDANPPGVLAQVASLWGTSPVWHGIGDPNALYVVVGGSNDMRDARTAFPTDSAADALGRQGAAQAALTNLASSLGFLAAHGAKHVLISNVPNLAAAPEAHLLGLEFASEDASDRFNALMPTLLAAGAGFGLDMSFLDFAGLRDRVLADIANGSPLYGITNITAPCAGFLYSTGTACSASLFADVLHPSAVAQRLIGEAAFAAAVPEPETYALFAVGLLGVVLRRRSRAGR